MQNQNIKNLRIVAITLMSLAFLFSAIIFSTSFFSANNTTSGTITLGELDFVITESEGDNLTIMPCETLEKSISVINSRDEGGKDFNKLCEFYFRYNVAVLIDDVVDENILGNMEFITGHNVINDADYLYYVGGLKAGEQTKLFESVKFLENISNDYQNKSIKLIATVEAVQAENNAYAEVWPDAPKDWVEAIKNYERS